MTKREWKIINNCPCDSYLTDGTEYLQFNEVEHHEDEWVFYLEGYCVATIDKEHNEVVNYDDYAGKMCQGGGKK